MTLTYTRPHRSLKRWEQSELCHTSHTMSYSLPQLPPRIPIKAEIIPTAHRTNAERRALVNQIVASVSHSTATFANVLAPLAQLEDVQSHQRDVIHALKYVSPNRETQAAVAEAEGLWNEYWIEEEQRLDLFKLVQTVDMNVNNERLDAESKKMISRKMRWYKRSGVGYLDPTARAQCLETRRQISRLCFDFNRVVREGDGAMLTFTEQELQGVPKSELQHFLPARDGSRVVPLRPHSYNIITTFAHSSEARCKMQTAWAQRYPKNKEILRNAILLRDENARRMGYPNHAEYRLPDRMMPSIQAVKNLLYDIGRGIQPLGARLMEELRRKKIELQMRQHGRENVDETAVRVESWDMNYLQNLVEQESSVNFDTLAEYFPLQDTIASILNLITSYLQLRLERVPPNTLQGHIWSDDVQVWSVWDEQPNTTEPFIGFLYTDMQDRPNKYKGNQAVNLQPGYLRTDGSRVYPSTVLMCNFLPKVVDKCPLLKHSSIATLFHEYGHALHDLLSRTKHSRFHGHRVISEFAEGIGSMMENWAWTKSELKEVGRHYIYTNENYKRAWQARNPGRELPSERIPDELLHKLGETRARIRTSMYLSQISDSLFDLTIHNQSSPQDLRILDEGQLYKNLQAQYKQFRCPEPCHLQTGFTHLMSGYDASYYAYVCATVFGQEMFQQNFAANPSSKSAWQRFRRGVLEHGGGREESEILEQFLGRKPSSDAILRSLSIE